MRVEWGFISILTVRHGYVKIFKIYYHVKVKLSMVAHALNTQASYSLIIKNVYNMSKINRLKMDACTFWSQL